jgi:hypothetical protein
VRAALWVTATVSGLFLGLNLLSYFADHVHWNDEAGLGIEWLGLIVSLAGLAAGYPRGG